MRYQTEPDFSSLVTLFEKSPKDPAAREALKAWFDGCVDAMLDGQAARRHLGTLAYWLAEKKASRKLGPGGRYEDLQNDPSSVASRHWERFQPFFEDIDRGIPKNLDQFAGWIIELTDFVLKDIARARKTQRDRERSIEEESALVDVPQEVKTSGDEVDSLEEMRALLRQIVHVLPPNLFLVVVLKGFCEMSKTEIATILDTTAYYVDKHLAEAERLLGQKFPPNP